MPVDYGDNAFMSYLQINTQKWNSCKIARNLASSDAQWQEKRRGSSKYTQAVHIPREPQASSSLRLRQLLWGEVAAGASLGAL